MTSTSSSSALQTFPSGLQPAVKDCFGLHGHSAFGSVAKEKSGVGQPPVVSLRSTILASPTLSISSRRARLLTSAAARLRSTDLLPPSALPRLLRSLRLSPPSRPAGCRLPAAAGHRAAVVDIADGGGPRVFAALLHQSCLCECYPSIDCHRPAILPYQRLQLHISLYSVTAIGDFETIDYSRLMAKMGVSGMRMSCKALIIGHSFAPERLCCGKGGRKADSCGLYADKSAQKPCWGSMAPLRRRSRRRRA